eukprot:CAMPEP_0204334314 /NCGR_PEP_ID=MMETSP0469-20131031/17931_1 /ASSEMBLY_ACC=CAM_ASM_000384 /TAXON_ID=2969 /ORGANISM="Oxyrrhis marina" /LENGTH=796 /DNA_ID=CAMNT_0051317811 /DNA_START=60 /DNA_END=2450 /DNA_ORIENTATION=+
MVRQTSYGDQFVDVSALVLSMLSSVYSLVTFVLLFKKYAAIHTNGNVASYIRCMRDLGRGLAPTNLLIDISKKRTVICTYEYLSESSLQEVVAGILKSAYLQTFTLKTAVDDHTVAVFYPLLETPSSLLHLHILNPSLSNEGAANFVRRVESNADLAVHIFDIQVTAENAALVADIMTGRTENRSIDDADMKLVGQVVRQTEFLDTLNLKNNYIASDGVSELIVALDNARRPIQHLILDGNVLSDAAAGFLSRFFRENKALRVLSVNGCALSRLATIQLLTAVLEKGVALETSNNFSDDRPMSGDVPMEPELCILGCEIPAQRAHLVIQLLKDSLHDVACSWEEAECELVGKAIRQSVFVKELSLQPVQDKIEIHRLASIVTAFCGSVMDNVKLNIWGYDISKRECSTVAALLRNELKGKALGPREAATVGQAIVSTDRIRRLDLTVKEDGVMLVLMKSLDRAMNRGLQMRINERGVRVEDAELVQRMLRHNCSNADLDDASFAAIAGTLPMLAKCLNGFRHLDLSGNTRVTSSGLLKVLNTMLAQKVEGFAVHLFGFPIRGGAARIVRYALQNRLSRLHLSPEILTIVELTIVNCPLPLELDMDATDIDPQQIGQIFGALERAECKETKVKMWDTEVTTAFATIYRSLAECRPVPGESLSHTSSINSDRVWDERIGALTKAVAVVPLASRVDLSQMILGRDDAKRILEAAGTNPAVLNLALPQLSGDLPRSMFTAAVDALDGAEPGRPLPASAVAALNELVEQAEEEEEDEEEEGEEEAEQEEAEAGKKEEEVAE